MTDRLAGKVALISGAAGGMGAAHAEHFVAHGAKVILGDIDLDGARALAARLGESALAVALNVTEPATWREAIRLGAERFGPVNVLVNNAGVSGSATSTTEISDEEWHRTIDIDLNGTFHGIRSVLPHMLDHDGGSIVNISSAAGMAAAPGVNIAYVAAKFAVRGMSKQVAIEYAQKGIRVNSVHPGAVRTPLTQALVEQLGPEFMEGFYASVPMHRIAEMKEVSDAVIFLASDESSFITGTELVVDGGLLAL
ncbi:SDR family NAD(P)-dependent oxidoreductase [Microbacterium sp. NPDC090225]|uniref:SDR family NAD(P)-dependent oxidoreductase n=1 Tax=Microbacterium sp. NPDC090225 TaxID=3364207 RepID=UPI003821AF4C